MSFIAPANIVCHLQRKKKKRNIGFLLTFEVLHCCARFLDFEVESGKLTFLATCIFSRECLEFLTLMSRTLWCLVTDITRVPVLCDSQGMFSLRFFIFIVFSISIAVSQILPFQFCGFVGQWMNAHSKLERIMQWNHSLLGTNFICVASGFLLLSFFVFLQICLCVSFDKTKK